MDKAQLHARVYITPKKGVLNPQGKAIEHSLHSLGFQEVGDVSLGKYVELSLRDTDRQHAESRLDEMCRKLLANGVIEDYRFELSE
jgi:phosphoribosylformylglycinamidine synthase PurS subunit